MHFAIFILLAEQAFSQFLQLVIQELQASIHSLYLSIDRLFFSKDTLEGKIGCELKLMAKKPKIIIAKIDVFIINDLNCYSITPKLKVAQFFKNDKNVFHQ